MYNECSILILSCDKNKQLLEFFFDSFNRYWKDCPYKIFVSLEKCKNLDVDKDIHIINYDDSLNWGARIIDALSQIKSTHVLIMLDDFIIEEKVDTAEIQQILNVMKENPQIANIVLSEIGESNVDEQVLFSRYVQRKKYGRYKTALQCGIWRTEILKNLFNPHENAWEFEIFSNIRSFRLNLHFYALIDDNNKPIPYNNGLLIVQGKINSAEKKRLGLKLGKVINFDNFAETGEELIRDNVSLLSRVRRRLKIMVYYGYYRFLFNKASTNKFSRKDGNHGE